MMKTSLSTAPGPAFPRTVLQMQVFLKQGIPGESAGSDALLLLARVLGQSKSWLLAHPEAGLSQEQVAQLEDYRRRLAGGEPLPYLLGSWEFYGLDFTVTPAVLIPRPETELLVETASGWLQSRPIRRRAADAGTGSGCIAVSLAASHPDLHVWASDLSRPALEVARQNVLRHQVQDRVQLVQSSLLTAFAGPFDLVCANLPYIPSADLAGLRVAQSEPRLALDGGLDGFASIQLLLADARRWLAPGGLALLEIEARQGAAAVNLARRWIPGARVSVRPDLAGLDRMITIEMADS